MTEVPSDSSAETPAPYGSGPAATATPPKRVRVHHLRAMKERGERFAMLTSYDQLTAEIFDEAGIPRAARRRLGRQQRARVRRPPCR